MKLRCYIRQYLAPQRGTSICLYIAKQNFVEIFIFVTSSIQLLSDILFFDKFVVRILSCFSIQREFIKWSAPIRFTMRSGQAALTCL